MTAPRIPAAAGATTVDAASGARRAAPPTASATEERFAVAPEVTLHVERRQGEPAMPSFVLVHGLASNVRLWDGVAEHLHARGHTVIALDQRGHGRSDAPEARYDLDSAVADLLALMDALGLDRPILAGQSWGGNVVLELAWRRPDVVRGITCVDGGIIELADWFPSWDACLAALTPPSFDHLTLAELQARLRLAHPDLPDRAIEAGLACFRIRNDGRVEPRLARHRHLEILRSLWEHRPSTRYATLGAPALLLLADTGDPVTTDAKRRAETTAIEATARIRSHWFAPGHHDLHAQFPERVADLMADAVGDGFFA
jgi:pimeloyl-ACP methyl ester carboxylesterase